MPGRPGRNAGRGNATNRAPKYLSLAPPILRSTIPSPLANNHYEVLAQSDYPRLNTIKIDKSTSIRTYSKNTTEFLESLRRSSTPLTPLPCVSDENNIIPSYCEKTTNNKNNKYQSHYHTQNDENNETWNIFSNRRSNKKYTTQESLITCSKQKKSISQSQFQLGTTTKIFRTNKSSHIKKQHNGNKYSSYLFSKSQFTGTSSKKI